MAGVEIATAYVNLVSSAGGLGKSITGEVDGATRGLDGQGSAAGGRFGKAFAGAAVAGLAGLAAFGAASIKSLARIEVINTQTESVIASTGAAAGVTAQHVEDLAGSLENLTGTEAETTQEGANFLLTFKEIKNGVGEGNDIFDQTTKAMVDLARATGTDMKGASLQLGKALNDPIKGVAALSRVGVGFTDQQKEQIKVLQESGDIMGAQKIILAELQSQFGGSAMAYADTAQGKFVLLGHAIGTLGESITAKALDPLGNLAKLGADAANKAAEWVDNFEGFGPRVTAVGDTIKGVFSILAQGDFKPFAGLEEDSGVVNFLFSVREGAQDAFNSVKTLVTGDFTGLNNFDEDSGFVDSLFRIREKTIEIAGGIGDSLKSGMEKAGPIVSAAADSISSTLASSFDKAKPYLISAFDTVKPVAEKAFAAVGPAFDKAKPLLKSAGESALSALASTFETLKPVLTDVFAQVGPVIGQVFEALGPLISQLAPIFAQLLPLMNPFFLIFKQLLPVLPQLAQLFGQIAVAVGGALVQAMNAILPILPSIALVIGQIAVVLADGLAQAIVAIVPVVLALADAFIQILPSLVQLIEALLPPMMALFASLVPLILAIVDAVIPLVQQFAEFLVPAINALMPVVETVFNAISGIITSVMSVIQGVINVVTGIITGNWSKVWEGIKGIFSGVWEGIKTYIGYILGVISGVISGVWEGIKGATSAAFGLVKSYIIDPLQAAYDWVTNTFSKIGTFFSNLWQGISDTASRIFGGIAGAVSKAFQGVVDFVKKPINGIINFLNSTIIWGINKLIDGANLLIQYIPGVPYIAHLGNIPTLAKGGVIDPVAGGQLLIAGEARQQEIVTPTQLMKDTFRAVLAESGGSGGSGSTYNIYEASDPVAVANAVSRRQALLGAV